MLLAQAGADVTIYERHPDVGGRSATISAKSDVGTFKFDMGPTFFLYPRVLNDIFAACGYDLQREIELIRLDPQYHLIFEAGGEIRATSDMTRLAEEVSRFAPQDAASLPRFFADNRAKLAAFRPILESPFNGPMDLMRPSMLRSLKLMRPHRTVDSDLATYFSDERVPLGLLVPVEIPRHVAVPLPEPVHHPLVHGIRIRRLPPARRLWCRDDDDGTDRPQDGRHVQDGRTGAGDSVRRPSGHRRA